MLWWPIRIGSKTGRAASAPEAIRTPQPPVRTQLRFDDVALMLPNRDGRSGALEAIAADPLTDRDWAAGLFLADPFVDPAKAARRLNALGVRWVANFPTIGVQDRAFLDQCAEVGLSVEREFEKLAAFGHAGLRILASATTEMALRDAAALDPDCIVICEPLADRFAPHDQRRARIAALAAAARSLGLDGVMLCADDELVDQAIADMIDGVLAPPM